MFNAIFNVAFKNQSVLSLSRSFSQIFCRSSSINSQFYSARWINGPLIFDFWNTRCLPKFNAIFDVAFKNQSVLSLSRSFSQIKACRFILNLDR